MSEWRPEAGLAQLTELEEELEGNHRLHAARAHLLERSGDVDGAVREYELAAALTRSLPERDYLTKRAARLRAAR